MAYISFKKIGLTMAILAIISGASFAVITTNAQGKMLDKNAAAYLQKGDIEGYKTYLKDQNSTRINAIDQAKFSKIQANYIAHKPILDLNAKYEPILNELAKSKNQSGFVSKLKEHYLEAKPLMEAQMKSRMEAKATNKTNKTQDPIQNNDKGQRPAPTETQLTDMATKMYNKALKQIESGKVFELNMGGRNHGNMKNGMEGKMGKRRLDNQNNPADQSQVAPTTNTKLSN